jgi:uncharacterized protein YndB with AHSA1/START domain
METTNKSINKIANRELILTKTINAPREKVFNSWIDPVHLAAWWGPKGFTNPLCEVDVRPGGAIRIDMKGPDGVVYPMGGKFQEIDKPKKLVFTSTAYEDISGNSMLEVLNSITFEEKDGKTTLTLHAGVVKSTPQVEVALAGLEQGWSESLEKLMEYVSKQ